MSASSTTWNTKSRKKRQKEFLRIAVSVVAMLPHDYQEVREHVSRRILEVGKLLAQPLAAHEAEDSQ